MRNDEPECRQRGVLWPSGDRHATFADSHLFEVVAGGELAVADEHEARPLVARGWVRVG